MADAELNANVADDDSDTDMPGLEVVPAAAPAPPSPRLRMTSRPGPSRGTTTMFLRELMDPELLSAFIDMANELPGPMFPDEVPDDKDGRSDWDTWSYENRYTRPCLDESRRIVTVEPVVPPTRVDTPLPSEVLNPEAFITPHLPQDTRARVERLIREYQTLHREDQLSVDAREPDDPHP